MQGIKFTCTFKRKKSKKKKKKDRSQSRAPAKQPSKPVVDWIPPESYMNQYPERVFGIYQIALKMLDLCTGIPDERKDEIAKAVSLASFFDKPEKSAAFLHAFSLLDGLDWKWLEWEKWRDICVAHNLFPSGMERLCSPFPDKPDIESSRRRYRPERIFSLISLQTAKERLWDFPPEVQDFDRDQMIKLLKKNRSAWHAVIDPHIQELWDRRPHYEGPTPMSIFALFCYTAHERYDSKCNDDLVAESCPRKKMVPTSNVDKALLPLALSDPDPLWKEPYGAVIPGMIFFHTNKDFLY